MGGQTDERGRRAKKKKLVKKKKQPYETPKSTTKRKNESSEPTWWDRRPNSDRVVTDIKGKLTPTSVCLAGWPRHGQGNDGRGAIHRPANISGWPTDKY